MEELQQLLTPLASPRPVHATLAHAPHSILNTLRPTLRPQHPIRTNRKLTLILLPVLGSSTLLTSLVNAATVPPTVPLLTTNDLGTLGALGSTEESVGLTCRGELARFFPPAAAGELTWVRVFLLRDPFLGILGSESWVAVSWKSSCRLEKIDSAQNPSWELGRAWASLLSPSVSPFPQPTTASIRPQRPAEKEPTGVPVFRWTRLSHRSGRSPARATTFLRAG